VEHAAVALLCCGEMHHTGHEGVPERSLIGPCGKDVGDGRVVDGRRALGVVWYGQALPLPACLQDSKMG
jgi:hypothetical protein